MFQIIQNNHTNSNISNVLIIPKIPNIPNNPKIPNITHNPKMPNIPINEKIHQKNQFQMYGLRVFLWCIGLVKLLRPPTASCPKSARVYCGCQPGPTRVALHPGRNQSASLTYTGRRATIIEEMWIIDVCSCTPPRPVRVHDLVDPESTSTSGLLSHFLVDCAVCCVRLAEFLPRC